MLRGVDQAQRDAGPGGGRARLPDPAGHDRGRRRARGARTARRRHSLRAVLARAADRRQQLARRRAGRRRLRAFLDAEATGRGAAAGARHRVHRLGLPARGAGTAAYGFSPFRTTPAEVLAAGYHNADERVHVDDLLLVDAVPHRPGPPVARRRSCARVTSGSSSARCRPGRTTRSPTSPASASATPRWSRGEGALVRGRGPVRTGVTVVRPARRRTSGPSRSTRASTGSTATAR